MASIASGFPWPRGLPGVGRSALAWLARELSVHGYHAQVITASGEAALDRQILDAVREAVGDGVQLRLDAQASYTLDAARDLCREIEGRQIQCLIDPLATRELYPVASLARQTKVPLGLWRAVRSPGDLLALARCDAACARGASIPSSLAAFRRRGPVPRSGRRRASR